MMQRIKQNLKKSWGWLVLMALMDFAPLLQHSTGISAYILYLAGLLIFTGWFVIYDLPVRRKASQEKAAYKKAFTEKVALAEAQLFGSK